MKRTKKTVGAEEKLLTEVELEMMTLLWRLGEGSVHQVLEALPQQRRLAYTSVSTILRILEQKGFLKSRKAGREHIYTPLLSKDLYEAKSLNHMVNKVFEGTPSLLVQRLLETEDLPKSEIEKIRAMLLERT